MDFTHFLKCKSFKMTLHDTEFTDAEFMSKEEKQKTYKDMVRFLSNHFKQTNFSKRLYEHFYLNSGFIAHYNQGGFYGEYFSTPASYYYNVKDFKNKVNEYGGDLNRYSSLDDVDLFSTLIFYSKKKELIKNFREKLNEYNKGNDKSMGALKIRCLCDVTVYKGNPGL